MTDVTLPKSDKPARIIGAFEHPGRKLPGYSLDRLYLEIMAGTLKDAGIGVDDIDGLITSTYPGSTIGLAEVLGLNNLRYTDGTDTGGSSYVSHAGRAARLVQEGRCQAVLCIMGGIPLQPGARGMGGANPSSLAYEAAHGSTLLGQYALVAQRHMYEYGTKMETLAEIKAASSFHSQYNPNALLQKEVTIQEVLDSPFIAEPLHRLDSCVTTDSGGAFIVASEEFAKELGKTGVKVLSAEEAYLHSRNGNWQITQSIAATTGRRAFETAGITVNDIDYASMYDSFTITVLVNLEGLGFFEPGQGAKLIADGELRAPDGKFPINTDGGGLNNSHPDFRGGMTRMLEAVRQLRGDAAPQVQIKDAEFAVVHGSGFSLGSRAMGATAILQRGDA